MTERKHRNSDKLPRREQLPREKQLPQDVINFIFDLSQTLSEQSRLLEEERAVRKSFEQAAITDAVTGLGNRRYLQMYCEELIKRKQGIGILFIDLKRFKPVNDTYGHDAGDELLKTIAKRLKEFSRPSDAVVRLGGDEFAILIPNISLENLDKRKQGFLETIENSKITRQGTKISVSASIGIAVKTSYETIEEFVKRADESMYKAKGRGFEMRNHFPTSSIPTHAGNLFPTQSGNGIEYSLNLPTFRPI